jgi:hypothetical protein
LAAQLLAFPVDAGIRLKLKETLLSPEEVNFLTSLVGHIDRRVDLVIHVPLMASSSECPSSTYLLEHKSSAMIGKELAEKVLVAIKCGPWRDQMRRCFAGVGTHASAKQQQRRLLMEVIRWQIQVHKLQPE